MTDDEIQTFFKDYFPDASETHWSSYITLRIDCTFKKFDAHVVFPNGVFISFSSLVSWPDLMAKARPHSTVALSAADVKAIEQAEYAGDNLPAPQ